MAYSKSVKVERLGGHNGLGFAPVAVLQFKGPGWMFFTTKLGGERRKQRQIAMGNLFLMMFLVINVLLIFAPLL